MGPPRLDQPFVTGSMDTPHGKVPRVSSQLRMADLMGGWKVRWGMGRMDYTVDPGLYALGDPGPASPVFVTANYKMSFDAVRRALPGADGWILALDTKGVNVWCAAGKGTFGTVELAARIEASGLSEVVSHRQLIVPQLGAPGVAAHEVKQRTGFQVIYGPIRADDLPAFMGSGLKATREMRTKRFDMAERLSLVPVELVHAAGIAVLAAAALFVLSFLLSGFSLVRALDAAQLALVAFGASILAGAVLTPVLLPWLPGRAFSIKGLALGVAAWVLVIPLMGGVQHMNVLGALALMVSIPAMAAFLAMNFTGASTYTSLSGVRKEMRFALPLEIAGCAVGLALFVAAHFAGGPLL